MNNEAVFVFAVIAIAAVLMASNRVRFDMVALHSVRKISGAPSV